MARIVKEYAVRRNEILDAAQRLVYTRGYEQMAIQDILDELHIAKGTFYHYFDSKQMLLEALLERIVEESDRQLMPIVQNTQLSALEKLQLFFATVAYVKSEQKTFLLAVWRVWYKDENALARQKAEIMGIKHIVPLFTIIIAQGIEQGIFSTPFPAEIGGVIMSIMKGLSDTIGMSLISPEAEQNVQDTLQQLERTIAAYTYTLERILGLSPGSLCIIETETLKEWLISLQDTV